MPLDARGHRASRVRRGARAKYQAPQAVLQKAVCSPDLWLQAEPVQLAPVKGVGEVVRHDDALGVAAERAAAENGIGAAVGHHHTVAELLEASAAVGAGAGAACVGGAAGMAAEAGAVGAAGFAAAAAGATRACGGGAAAAGGRIRAAFAAASLASFSAFAAASACASASATP